LVGLKLDSVKDLVGLKLDSVKDLVGLKLDFLDYFTNSLLISSTSISPRK